MFLTAPVKVPLFSGGLVRRCYVLTDLDYGSEMPELYEVITRLLKVMGRSAEWYIVDPVPGDLRGFVMIQNRRGVQLAVPISTKDIDDLTDDQMIVRLFSAIADLLDSP